MNVSTCGYSLYYSNSNTTKSRSLSLYFKYLVSIVYFVLAEFSIYLYLDLVNCISHVYLHFKSYMITIQSD